MFSSVHEDFNQYLTNLALRIEQEYASRNDIKVTVNKNGKEWDIKGTAVTINMEGEEEELTISYDMSDIDETSGGSSYLEISCESDSKYFHESVERSNGIYEYDEETCEYIPAAEPCMSNAEFATINILRFIKEAIND